jgi:hypothetical protein
VPSGSLRPSEIAGGLASGIAGDTATVAPGSLRARSAGGRAISGTTVATAAASNPPAVAIIPHVATRFIVGSSRGSSPRQERAHVAK